MERLFDWAARPAERLVTVGSLRSGKGTVARHAQVTADTAEEAAAAEAAEIEMVVFRADNAAAVRQGSRHVFVTAALGFAEAVTDDDILRVAFRALTEGADAVITARSLSVVSRLAAEDIPVMGHLGFVPRKSTWVGRTRVVGKTADEAEALWHRFRRLEEAGAFAVEVELVAAPLLAEITRRSRLVTVSLGSGSGGDVIFLFGSDICGEEGRMATSPDCGSRSAMNAHLPLPPFAPMWRRAAFRAPRTPPQWTPVNGKSFWSVLGKRTAALFVER